MKTVWGLSRAIVVAGWLGLSVPAMQAADIDYGQVGHPEQVRLADRSAETRWKALFEAAVDWPARQVTYLSDRLPNQAATLLAARLLYQGEPWVRRTGDQANLRRWRANDRAIKLDLLREMRALRDPALADVLAYHLGQEKDPLLVTSSLVTLWTIDPARSVALAVRLGDPRTSDHLPGSAVSGVRQDALRFLIGIMGPESAEARQALGWALFEGRSGERLHGVSQVPQGRCTDLLRATILALAPRHQELDEDDRSTLITASVRLGGDLDGDLVASLAALAVNAARDVAVPAATALASNVTWRSPVSVQDIARRAREDPDPVVRNALANLLLRVSAQAIDLGPDSPWTRLSRHRERLAKWEWEQFVK